MRINDYRWTTTVSDWIPQDVKCTAGRPATRRSEFFKKTLEQRYDAQRLSIANRTHWGTLPRDKEKWEIYWRRLESFHIQRDYRVQVTQVIRSRIWDGSAVVMPFKTNIALFRLRTGLTKHLIFPGSGITTELTWEQLTPYNSSG
ncbi:unnamed protein product [Angiostrongylus costaricensis]|uniref:Tox-REase-5 domain-containing protein n=1 Tax=Angiostrongylus costaricensis TaxID=334426 RepID=A0A0R3PRK0_ANGCS|nr:unnamed protein product [Angiostrongylus costaricensis]